ncbi:LOW QUALITY PROTEIN: RUN and SH3 domain-containing protein 1 [Tachyglossus aculeatus]|uniref:LOW QUALITY PROTEIN: RUN and SH3 domain-containing protein 1 n=1 Tax=Tachyglossus aculeatus TaxID=9261 RepID=UPI0018F3FCD8|nr:LOW QUALITY PROTEIN: RUN and SH3 domain-containing protein 1 [Tachyglossus aculeatus]
MLSPQLALPCNLNHLRLQHVALGLRLAHREGTPAPAPAPPLDANSNSPAVPCRCCGPHTRHDGEEEGEGREEQRPLRSSPSTPTSSCSSSSSSSSSSSLGCASDLSPDFGQARGPSAASCSDGPPEPLLDANRNAVVPPAAPAEPPSPPRRPVTSFHELAKRRKRGPAPARDRADWLIVFSPDAEQPPVGVPGPPAARQVVTFRELRLRGGLLLRQRQQRQQQQQQAEAAPPPPPVPPRGGGGTPGPPPPVPPRRTKTRPGGLQPIAEGRPGDDVRAPAGDEPAALGDEGRGDRRGPWLWMADDAERAACRLRERKRGLLVAVSASVDKIIAHFGAARNLVQKAQLGDSRLSPEVGHLVLGGLCPALHALLSDGLKPFRGDVITGQRRCSPWTVVEASVRAGAPAAAPRPAGSLAALHRQIARLTPLGTNRSRFHAFVLGLLNTKQLELWFGRLQEDEGLLSVLYVPSAFVRLAREACPPLARELLLLLQPLSVLSFRLDLLFEPRHHVPPAGPSGRAPPPPAPPAPHDAVRALLGWGQRLARGWQAPAPASPPLLPGGWWVQLSRATRVYASGPGRPREGEAPGREPGAGPSGWPGRRLFGAPGVPAEAQGGPLKSRRPSSWLPPAISILALVKKGDPPQLDLRPEEDPEDPGHPAPSPPQAHRTVRALCDHAASGPDQLSFRKGEVLRVVSPVDEDWLRCGREGAEGLVPVGYTSLIL